MDIKISNDERIYTEEDNNVLFCGIASEEYLKNKPERVYGSKIEPLKIFDCYVCIDKTTGHILDKKDVEIEDFNPIFYINSNISSEKIQICYITDPIGGTVMPNKDKPKRYFLFAASLSLLFIFCLIYFDVKTPIYEYDIINNLSTEGYLYIDNKDSVDIKVFVTNDISATGDNINWEKVNFHISSSDTLYPKSNCKIFLNICQGGKFNKEETTYSYEFNFNDFVKFIILNYQDTKYQTIAEQLFGDISNSNITFDDGLETAILSSSDDFKYSLHGYISEMSNSAEIDTISFYPSIHTDIQSSHYPHMQYIKLK